MKANAFIKASPNVKRKRYCVDFYHLLAFLIKVADTAFRIPTLLYKSCTLPLYCLNLYVPLFLNDKCSQVIRILCICYIFPWLSVPKGNELLQILHPCRILRMKLSCFGDAYGSNTPSVSWCFPYLLDGTCDHLSTCARETRYYFTNDISCVWKKGTKPYLITPPSSR